MPGPESSSHEPEAPVTPLATLEPAELEAATEEALDDVEAILDEAEAPAPAEADKAAPAPAAGKDYEKEVWDLIKNDNGKGFVDLFGDFAEILGNKITGASGIDEDTWTAVAQGAGLGIYGQEGVDPEVAKLSPKEREKIAQAKVDIDRAPLSSGEMVDKKEWLWPNASHFTFRAGVSPRVTSDPQGYRETAVTKGAHNGVDIGVPIGAELILTQSAVVTEVQPNRNKGLKVRVRFADGTEASFGHLDSFPVKEGQKIEAGQAFAKTGNTGKSTGPHLHFQTYDRSGGLADPFPFMRGSGLQPKAGKAYVFHHEYDDSHEQVADEGHEGHDHGEAEAA